MLPGWLKQVLHVISFMVIILPFSAFSITVTAEFLKMHLSTEINVVELPKSC